MISDSTEFFNLHTKAQQNPTAWKRS